MSRSQETERLEERADVVVVGGGIAGLVAALTVADLGASVVVLDAQSIGGRAKTIEREGYSYNTGPHALYQAGHLHALLVRRDMLPRGGVPVTKTIGMVRDGRIRPFGVSAIGIAGSGLLKARSRARLLKVFALLPKLDVTRLIGTAWEDFLGNEPDDVAGVIAAFGRVATYVNAPRTFDAATAIEQIRAAQRGVLYVDGGWQAMVATLAQAVRDRGGVIHENRPVIGVVHDGGAAVEVNTDRGSIGAKAVILAGLAPDAVERLTATEVRGASAIGGEVRAAVLDVALRSAQLGVVFGIDEPLYLSAHAPVARLAPDGGGLITLMRYVPDGEADRAASEDRDQLRWLAAEFGIDEANVVHERYLHRLVVSQGFPTAAGGGRAGRPDVDAVALDGVFIAGDWVGPDGVLVDASAASAERAAKRAVSHVERQSGVRA